MNEKALLDITKGAFDEVGKVVSRFLLHKLCQIYQRKDLRIYHNDALAVFENRWLSLYKFATPFFPNC